MTPLLSVEHLSISFTQYDRGTRRRILPAIRDLDLTINRGQVAAVVGSSGSGKSLLAHGILGILPYNAHMEGTITYDGAPLTPKRAAALRGREIVLVPQSVSYLDPLRKVGPQVGQDNSPALVIADEPTPGLDVRAAGRILGHFRELADAGAGVLLITHDLELALTIADKVAVFYAGETVEEAPAGDFDRLEDLRHPYTRALWQALPQHGFHPISGTQPYPGALPEGCPFAPRCPKCTSECGGDVPYRPLDGGFVRCLYPERGNAS